MLYFLKFKIVLIASIITFGTNTISAQYFAVKAGLNYSGENESDKYGSEDGVYTHSSSRIIGFHAGITKSFMFSSGFGIQTGCLITSKGIKNTQYSDGWSNQSKRVPIYLEVPLDFKFSGKVGNCRLYGLSGLYYARLIGGNITSGVTSNGITTNYTQSLIKEKLHSSCRNDLGWNFALGLEFKRYLVEVKYSESFYDSILVFNSRQKVFGISLGYMLCLKSKDLAPKNKI